jgi:hypothetical protein
MMHMHKQATQVVECGKTAHVYFVIEHKNFAVFSWKLREWAIAEHTFEDSGVTKAIIGGWARYQKS